MYPLDGGALLQGQMQVAQVQQQIKVVIVIVSRFSSK